MESVIESLPSVSRVIDRHSREVMDLNIPSIQDFNSSDTTTKSPFVNQFQLDLAYDDLIKMKGKILQFSRKRSYREVAQKLNDLLGIIDEKKYVNKRLIEGIQQQSKDKGERRDTEEESTSVLSKVVLDEDNLTSLRKRLLANGKSSTLLDEKQENINNQHDSFQSEIINDLSDLSKVLKDSALKFSSRLFEDTKALNETEHAMMKNSSLMDKVSGNLGDYLTNKSGNTIGLWWMIKVSLGIFLAFIFIIIIIKIFPHM